MKISLKLIIASISTVVIYLISLLPQIGMKLTTEDSSQYLKIFDVIGISVRSGKNYLPFYFEKNLADLGIDWRESYDIYSANQFFWGPGGFDNTTSIRTQLETLTTNWINAILENPLVYFSHRWDHFLAMLGVGQTNPPYVSERGIVSNEFNLEFNTNPLSNALFYISDLQPQLFFVGWHYLLAMLVSSIILVIISKQLRPLVFVLLSTSTIFVASHFFIGPAPDFRYFFYAYTASLLLVGTALSMSCFRFMRFCSNKYRLRQSNL